MKKSILVGTLSLVTLVILIFGNMHWNQKNETMAKTSKVHFNQDNTIESDKEEKEIKWVSYGDSITELNTWQPKVAKTLGYQHINRGVGSTRISGNSFVAPESGVKKYMMNTDERIDKIPNDTELITVMGGSNDWSVGTPIGEISDKTNETFFGAYQIMLDKIKKRIPDAQIIILLPPFRDQEGDMIIKGQKLEDFRDATVEIAEEYDYPVINTMDAGINQSNYTEYLMDVVHPNEAGGDKIADVVIGGLKEINDSSK